MADLPQLLDPVAARAWFREAGVEVEGVERGYVRLKPGAEALVAFTFHRREPDGTTVELPGYVCTLPGQRAAEVVAKWSRLRPRPGPFGDGVRLLPNSSSILFLFPNDRRLRGLHLAVEGQKLKRLLAGTREDAGWRVRGRRSHSIPVRYKPERRYIARGLFSLKNDRTGDRDSLDIFLRFFPDTRGREIDERVRFLGRQPVGPHLPKPLGSLLQGRLFLEHTVPGRPLLDLVQEGAGDPLALAAILDLLHRSCLGSAFILQPDRKLSDARAALTTLASLDQGLASLARELERRLAHSHIQKEEPVAIHGDLHLRQVLDCGGRLVLVDFERSAWGHPLEDLGSLVANLLFEGLRQPSSRERLQGFGEAVVDAYLTRTRPARRGELALFTASTLAELALLPFRRLEEDWESCSRTVLELAIDTLARPPGGQRPRDTGPLFFRSEMAGPGPTTETCWEVFHPRREGPWPGVLRNRDGQETHGLYLPAEDRFLPVSAGEDPVLVGPIRRMASGEILARRAGQRAVVRIPQAGSPVYAKVLAPRKAARLHQRVQAAALARSRSPSGFPLLPPLLDARLAEGVLFFGHLPGNSLHNLLMTGDQDVAEVLILVARSLAVFHQAEAQDLQLPSAREDPDPEWACELVARHFPEKVAAYQRLAHELPPHVPPARPRQVHGDLHDKNILVHPEGVGLLDLDSLRGGHPVEDVGNLAAHLLLRSLQREGSCERGHRQLEVLKEAYPGSESWTAALWPAAVARTLFRLSWLYLFRRRWRHLCPSILEECHRWCIGSG